MWGNSRVTVGTYDGAIDQSKTYFRISDLDGDGRISKLKLLLSFGVPIFPNWFLLRFFPLFLSINFTLLNTLGFSGRV
ncbi:hypothetical protein FNV43_RR27191 [Rhamnella rubrinervis]|uniref:EF-hand domain-containing protein n=1 Tax=Rhamnella rubrinervis TaxID=2594499 RepID=A0A8K0DPI6_9ROSA|nr:hypothetical protein FNV43_RR27191 [Rhamnella rubrinervis]